MHRKIVIGLAVSLVFGAVATAEIRLTGSLGDDTPTITYSPVDGTFSFEHPTDEAGANAITTLEILWEGEGDFFTGERPASFTGLFDVWTGGKAFRLDPAGFTSLGPWGVTTNISADDFGSGISVDGSFVGGGSLNVDAIYNIPEPSTLSLIGLGCLGLAAIRLRK